MSKDDFIYLGERLAYVHRWLQREIEAAFPHPTVIRALAKHQPKDMDALIIEWPHVSDDGKRIAYTQSPDKGERNIQTVTSEGKYLRRHFPQLQDHDVRDIVALSNTGAYNIVRSIDKIIEVIAEGPTSCMGGSSKEYHFDDESHPYRVYDPSLGWAMASYTNEEGRIDGRCLVLEQEDQKIFVRSYRRCFNEHDDEAYSEAHEGLEAWLKGQGYKKKSYWPSGTKLKLIWSDEERAEVVMPYIDGGERRVKRHYNHIVIGSGGVAADETSGYLRLGPEHECDECGSGVRREDDLTTVGEDGDECVCDSCLSRNFTMARGGDQEEYYVRDSEVVQAADGTSYHERYIEDYDLVRCEDGGLRDRDDCELVRGDWYDSDSNKIVELADGELELKSYALRCCHDEKWYASGDLFVFESSAGLNHCVHVDNVDSYLALNPDLIEAALEQNVGELSVEVIEKFFEYDPDNAKARGFALPDLHTQELELEHA